MRSILYLLAFTLTSCGIAQDEEELTYLALGDSYTIGESVDEEERWPEILADYLSTNGAPTASPNIIARTGWRTDDLMRAMDQQLDGDTYDLVSVLIGVNNQFQGKSIEQYETDLKSLFEDAASLCVNGKDGVFVLSIPDYGVTPFGSSDADRIGAEIDEWNAVCEKVCDEFGIPFYNITEISRRGLTDPELVARDGLHPSGNMYYIWVEMIGPLVLDLID